MKVFVTGATGYVGSAVVRELLEAGHQVLGLARTDDSAASLTNLGVEVQRGSLEDFRSLRDGATAADGVIHTAFNNISATTKLADAAEADRRAIQALGEALAGTDRPFVVTSAIGLLKPGRLGTEGGRGRPGFSWWRAYFFGRNRAVNGVAGGARIGCAPLPVGAWRRRSWVCPRIDQHCPREGRVGLPRRRFKSLVCRASARRRSSVSFGAGERNRRLTLSRCC